MAATEYISATGRRKSSVARVRLKPGKGDIVVNGKPIEEYFCRAVLRLIINQPLAHLELEGKMDIMVNTHGGGHSGQAGALRHGISRCLIELDPSHRPSLKAAGFLTRDDRGKERKKYGLKGARASYQFSKR